MEGMYIPDFYEVSAGRRGSLTRASCAEWLCALLQLLAGKFSLQYAGAIVD